MAFQWLALKRAPASSSKAVLAKLVSQPDHTETRPIALFGVLAVTHHDLGVDCDVRADTGGPGLDALRRPVLAEPVVRRHVIAPLGTLLRNALPGSGCVECCPLPEVRTCEATRCPTWKTSTVRAVMRAHSSFLTN
jgi:hypothetical protein